MFTRRRSSRVAAGAAPTAAQVDQVVRAAEEIVRRARAVELVRHRDYLELTVRTAHDDCETAYRAVALAQYDGDPRLILAAHADLELALSAVRNGTAVLERVRNVLRMELVLLARTSAHSSRARAVTDLIRQLEHDVPAIATTAAGASAAPWTRPAAPPRRWWHRFRGSTFERP